ncbi:MAG: J domain-containing protein [Janthinobacterium lividum]
MTKKYKLHPFFNEVTPLERQCEYEGCLNKGEFKAPRSRENLRNYRWFCLEHVRLYNESWNYYQGMDPSEIDHEQRWDETWQRPTWPFTQRVAKNSHVEQFEKDFLNFEGDIPVEKQPKFSVKFAPGSKESRALTRMDMQYPYTQKQLKIRYLELAKKYHPDMNQGSREAEEQLKEINLAYEFLKTLIMPKI